jgi:hypothetical protein
LVSVVIFVAGCGSSGLSASNKDIAQKDALCAQHVDDRTCSADSADECSWIAYGRPCPATGPCVSGLCQGPLQGGGAITDGGACPAPSPACAAFSDETACIADTGDHCVWYALGRPCPDTGPCVSGVCQQAPVPGCAPDGGGGGSSGRGCACPNGGVCVQKDGAPIACEQPISGCVGGASACGCLPASDGACAASPDVTGLCICTTPPAKGCHCASGQVCVEQIGGPAIPAGSPPNLLCVTPTPACEGGPSSCGCIAGQGRCTPSTSGPAQCTCDNGIR